MASKPTFQADVRARIALEEVRGIREGRWHRDSRYSELGATLLDRYENLAYVILGLETALSEIAGGYGKGKPSKTAKLALEMAEKLVGNV